MKYCDVQQFNNMVINILYTDYSSSVVHLGMQVCCYIWKTSSFPANLNLGLALKGQIGYLLKQLYFRISKAPSLC